MDAERVETNRAEPDPTMLLVGCTDAQEWARQFVDMFEGKRVGPTVDDDVDAELMLAWFANAIMAGHDSATVRERARALVECRLALARHDASRHAESALSWIGRHLPQRVRYWTALGLLAEATTAPELYDFEVPGVTIEQLLPVIGRITSQS